MRPIEIKENVIEIPFRDKDGKIIEILYFRKSDDNIKKFMDAKDEISELRLKIDNTNDLEDAREMVKKAYEAILGEGSFDKVYAINPATTIMVGYLAQITEGILMEIFDDMKMDALNKYVKGVPNANTVRSKR